MIVSLPLQLWALPGEPTASHIHAVLSEHYAGKGSPRGVTVAPLEDSEAFRAKLDPEMLNDTDRLEIHVFANEKHRQAIVCAVLDNLGKGASGQAVQNMNIMLGLPQTAGLS
jgi:N-acetyl-gamma-glutamyl-phosphate reductase